MAHQTEAEIRVGSSAFTAAGWEGTFDPKGMRPRDFLSYHATRFNTVEGDSTFYRTPPRSTITGWANKTPPGFVFALQVPQASTQEKCLEDCGEDFKTFVDTAEGLGNETLGPMRLQFACLHRAKFKTGAEFLARLRPWLKKVPQGHQFALEIRNKNWLDKKFTEILREHDVALAVMDQAWMPGLTESTSQIDPITSNFTCVRWLGDRKEIEGQTEVWDKPIVDRCAVRPGGLLLPNQAPRHQSVRLREQSRWGFRAFDRRTVPGVLGEAEKEFLTAPVFAAATSVKW